MFREITGKLIFNVIGFYICWWFTILGVIKEYFFIGPLAVILFLIVHFYKVSNHKKEDLFLVICFFLGAFIETTLFNLDIIIHKGILIQYNIAPLWAISLWVCFGATIYHSFKWMSKQYIISSILGVMFAPIVYFSFRTLGIVEFGMNNIITGLSVSAIWGLFIPLFIIISDRKLEL